MPSRLDLNSLRAFVAVADEGSIRRAAERLHVAQPPLTRRLRALEVLLGTALFVRAASGTRLTADGEHLLRRARRLLADADHIADEMRERSRAGGRDLAIGVSAGLPIEAAGRLAKAWKRAVRSRPLQVRSDFSLPLLAGLRSGELSFGIVGLPADLPGFRLREVYAEPMVAALPRHHAAARKREVSLADLGETPFFWNRRSFNPAFYDACDRAFRAAGFRPRYHHVEPAQVLTLERIANGEGCTLLNRWRASTRLAGLVYRPLAEGSSLAMRFATAWREGGESDVELRRLEETAARVLGVAARATPRSPGRRA